MTSMIRILVAISLVVASCASPRSQRSDAETTVNKPASKRLPEAPWVIQFADGSNNAYQVWAAGSAYRIAFSPMTPERSSSGTYSGGEPFARALTEAEAFEIWRVADKLANDTSKHVTARAMGTGNLAIVVGDDKTSFIVASGAELARFTALLASMGE